MSTYLLSTGRFAATMVSVRLDSWQQRLDNLFVRAEGNAAGGGDNSGKLILGMSAGLAIALGIGVFILCIVPICVIAILTLLGPAIGNVFTEIQNDI